MRDVFISESGMSFGPYAQDMCFQVETSQIYTKLKQDVKMAEFLLLKSSTSKSAIWVIEAKSSTPRPETQPGFDIFIGEIKEKMENALSLFLAANLGRHEDPAQDLPDPFRQVDLAKTEFKFVLIIRGHQEAWLAPLTDALQLALTPLRKTWNFTRIIAINDVIAREQRLIQ